MPDLVQFIRDRFSVLSDPGKAHEMAAYMKTDMPFYGVQKPERVPVYREMVRRFPVQSRRAYQAAILALWKEPHREEKYAAIAFARGHREYVNEASIPFYKRLIREGAWWDLVDEVAVQLVGQVWRSATPQVGPIMDEWVDDRSLWVRRSALIGQLKHKEKTDEKRLFEYCRRRAAEEEFFIRKAIGWALRQYSYVAPERVHQFLLANRTTLSRLSFREGAKQLLRRGVRLQ